MAEDTSLMEGESLRVSIKGIKMEGCYEEENYKYSGNRPR